MRKVLGNLVALGGGLTMLAGFGGHLGILFIGLLILVLGAVILGAKDSHPVDTGEEDLVAKEHNRKVAVELATGGGIQGVLASQWVAAYERDPSVPIFGVRPYWTPTGPQGAPQLLSLVGLKGVEDRLAYVRNAELGDSLLPIMAEDPNSRVREAARAKIQ